MDDEYDMFSGASKITQNLQNSHKRNPSAQVQITTSNYMDDALMVVEDTNEEDIDKLVEQKRKDKSNVNSDVRGSFLVSSPHTDFDYFAGGGGMSDRSQKIPQTTSQFKIQDSQRHAQNIDNLSTDYRTKSNQSQQPDSNVKKSNKKDDKFNSQISNQSSNNGNQQNAQEFVITTPIASARKETTTKNVNIESQNFSMKNFTIDKEFDILKQVQIEEQKEEAVEDYMDKFFDQPSIDRAEDTNQFRNRRTQPLYQRPDDFKAKFKNVRNAIDEGNSGKYSEQKVKREFTTGQQQQQVKTSQFKIQDQDMLDGDFKIGETKPQNQNNIAKTSNQVIQEKKVEDSKHEKRPNQFDNQKYLDRIKLIDEQQREEYVPTQREKSPDIISNNEETLEDDIELQNQGDENSYRNEDDQLLRIDFSHQDFTKDYYTGLHQDVLLKDMSPRSKKRVQLIQRLTKDEWDYKDVIRIIDWNERRHREVAYQHLKQNSVISLQDVSTKDIRIRVLTQFQNMNSVSNKMLKERSFSQARATCIALTDSLVLIGNSEGQLWMFDRENEEEYANFSEKSKDFLGNSVTVIDVHNLRPEYVVMGYERGQLVLVDIQEPKKSVKVIKDHHKMPIMNVKFCDWQDGSTDEDKQAWMFISIDQQGQVIINTVTKVLFIMKASKHVVIDPLRYEGPIYASISSRFQSSAHGFHPYDSIPIFAIGNAGQVDIIEAKSGKHNLLMTIERPSKFFNKSANELQDFKARVPSLSWGYGHTPAIKDKAHSILAIAWGPLVQLVVLFDSIGTDDMQPFITDGYYVIRNFGIIESPFHKLPNQSQPQSRRSTLAKFMEMRQSQNFSEKSTPLKNQNPFANDELTLELTSETENFEVQKNFNDSEIISQEYDDSEAFTQSGMDIEQIQFFSDSTLLIVTKQQEIRILNVSSFHPDTYDAQSEQQKLLKQQQSKKKAKSNTQSDISEEVELEYGLRISSQLQKSEYGALYHQTIRFYKGKIIALTIKNIQQCQHLSWQQSIFEFKKIVEDDLVLVFSRALDIYKGNVKGYASLPDNLDQRENKLKDEIKLLVREIIQQVIYKTRQATSILKPKKEVNQTAGQTLLTSGDNDQQSSKATDQIVAQAQQVDIEFKDEKLEKFKTLIRIAIEFCVELKDQRFLFYDLFLLFKNEKLEDAFIHELEPFIMAGRFQEWELPNEVIQNHVLKYYKENQKADQLEKIIVNLNLAQCPKTIVLEFIHYSEQNFLTTAILYLYTQVFEKKDNTSCVQILFSLFDLYKKAGKKNQGLLIDIQNLKEFTYESKEKQKVEKSQIYLGYKILWVIRMFLNGQKFPQGTIRASKWKTYIHDILELLQAADILKVLLEIDAETFFQTISIIFFPSKPSELFDQGRDENTNDQQIQNKLEIVEKLRKAEQVQKIKGPQTILELSKLADPTQFNQVKILLMEKRQEYLKCLNMFVNEFKIDLLWTKEMQKDRVVKWIREKTIYLEEKSLESPQDKNLYEQFKREVQQNISKILVINPSETIHLVEEQFQSQHKEMVNYLNRDSELQLLYLDTLLVEKREHIEVTIKSHGLQSTNTQDAKKFIELLKLHLRLSCKYAKHRVLDIVQKMVKDVYYPIEDCLEICQEFNIIEATFLLNRKVGKYFDCIKQGLHLLQEKVDYPKLKVELYLSFEKDLDLTFPFVDIQMPQIQQFDALFKQILKICKKNYREVEKDKEQELWYMVVEQLQSYITNPLFGNKYYAKQFFRNRLQIFSEQLVRAIPFQQYLQHELDKNKWMRLKEFGGIMQNQLSDLASEYLVLSNANTAIFKVNTELFAEYQMSSRRGILYRQRLCIMCKRYMDSFMYGEYSPEISDQQQLLAQRNEEEQEDNNPDTYNQPIKIFACHHTFHLACLERHFKRRKKNESDLAYQRRIEKLRCPTCNLKIYDLDSISGTRAQRRTPKNNALNSQVSSKFDFSRFESSQSFLIKNGNESFIDRKISQSNDDQLLDKTELWERERQKRIVKQQADQQRHLELIQKRMERYETAVEIDGLSIKDFQLA
eukprot:403368713